jgi:membrane protease YdiL (CAAX protease family)
MFARGATPLVLLGAGFVIAGLFLLDVVGGAGYTLIVSAVGAIVVVILKLAGERDKKVAWLRRDVDIQDVVAIGLIYMVVVLGFRLAFTVFTTVNVLGLFLSFAASLVIGVAAPIYYSVWLRGRPLASLGIGLGSWRWTAALALIFGIVQYSITLARIAYPPVETWLPLLVMALVVGLFEAIFFRGFIQNRLEASFGLAPALAVAAGLYGLYHVGYGMGLSEIALLIGLGLVYAVAFRVAGSVFVLWPLLTPLGSLFNQLESATFTLPMESIFGFADILGVMVALVWLARRHERRASVGQVGRHGAAIAAT